MDELQELRLLVPTYNATFFAKEVERNEKPEYGDPHVQVLVREAEGVRIVLGTHDHEDLDKPDIWVERQPQGWVIFLHPDAGGDPCGYVYFLDDGRSFLVKETYATPPIEIIESSTDLPEIHGPLADAGSAAPVAVASQFQQDDGLPEPDSVWPAASEEKVTVRSVDDCLSTDEAYEFASELRSLAYFDEDNETWRLDMKLGNDFVAAVKRLLQSYKLAPFPR